MSHWSCTLSVQYRTGKENGATVLYSSVGREHGTPFLYISVGIGRMAYRSCTVYSIVGRKNGPLILYTLIENLADEATVLLSSVTKFSVIFLFLTKLYHSVISQI